MELFYSHSSIRLRLTNSFAFSGLDLMWRLSFPCPVLSFRLTSSFAFSGLDLMWLLNFPCPVLSAYEFCAVIIYRDICNFKNLKCRCLRKLYLSVRLMVKLLL